MMYFVISILGVLIVGLTAYDTQKIKNMYVSQTWRSYWQESCYGSINVILRLYQLIYNVVKIIWTEDIL